MNYLFISLLETLGKGVSKPRIGVQKKWAGQMPNGPHAPLCFGPIGPLQAQVSPMRPTKGPFGNVPNSENFYSFIPRNSLGTEMHLVNFLFPSTFLQKFVPRNSFGRETRSKKKLLLISRHNFENEFFFLFFLFFFVLFFSRLWPVASGWTAASNRP